MSPERGPNVAPVARWICPRPEHLEPGSWPHTERVIEAMDRAIDVLESMPPAERPRHQWGSSCAACRVRDGMYFYERGCNEQPAPTHHTKLAREWRDSWGELERDLTAALDRVAALEELSPQEVAPGEVRWRAPEIRQGVARCPPAFRDSALSEIRTAVEEARAAAKAQHDHIPEPPRTKAGKLGKLSRRGYVTARGFFAPIRAGFVRRRDGEPVDIGDRVTDTELALAMLEAPRAWAGRVCADLADSYLFDFDDDIEAAAGELAKRIRSSLGPRETR